MKRRSRNFRQPASVVTHARGCFLALVALARFASTAMAGGVRVEVEEYADLYRVEGSFATNARPEVAWQVLTDYDHIQNFVHSVRSSAFERDPSGRRLLRQNAVAGPFPIRKTVHVLLDLQEERERAISFQDVLGRDFRAYTGHWSLAADGDGSVIHYQLLARPLAAIPHFLGRGVMTGAARDLLDQVRLEMERRETRRRTVAGGRGQP